MSGKTLFALVISTVLVWSANAQDHLLQEAARLDGEHRCDEAERYYRQALAKGSPSTALFNNYGNHFVACGQPGPARQWFERVLKANPAHANANLQLARIEVDQKHGVKALVYLKHLDESEVPVQLLRAEALQLSGQRAAASAILERLDQDASRNPDLLFALGLACARMERYDQAESAFNRVLSIYPQDFDVLVNLGRAAARAGHHDRGQRALEAALRIQPGDPNGLLELGLSHAARQDYSRAVFLLAQASERAPNRPDILLALARAAEGAGYYGDASLAYDRYLNLRPDDEIALRDRALVWGLSESRLADGLQVLESHVRKHPGDAIGHYDLAQLLWRSDPDRALNELTAAVRANGKLASVRLARGWLLYRMGRAAESLPDLLAADKASPKDPRILTQIGVVYLALDRLADAEKALRQALTLAPDDPETLLHLGRCLMARDRPEEAQVFLNQFQKLRPQSVRGPRKEAGLIEMASMPEAKRIQRDVERLRREAASHPGDPELLLNLATLLLATANTSEAVREFRKLLSGRADRGILRKAGAVLTTARQYGPARELLERAAVEDEEARVELAWVVFCTDGLQPGSRVLESVPERSRSADYFLVYARMLDTSGHKEESATMLQQGLRIHPSHPEFARQASFLLLRQGRNSDAIELLKQALQKIPDDPDLLLRLAVALAVAGDTSAAERGMRGIEAKWPEWERPYLLHGVLLERTLPVEARQKFQTAIALGLSGEMMGCAKARVDPSRAFDSKCTCFSGLLDWFEEACSGGEKYGKEDLLQR
jgi:tetratricopeptide (TPR) repeat protein